jgi:hypothetical protein
MFILGTYHAFTSSSWNILVGSAPYFVGIGTAWGVNMLGRKRLNIRSPSSNTLLKGCAFTIGAAVSVAIALRMPQLVPFSGDQIFKLWFCPFAIAGTTLGYLGQRSLIVIGLGGAYIGSSNFHLGFS